MIPTSAHIPIPYVMAYDLQPLVTIEEKTKLYSHAIPENWVLYFEHDPDHGFYRIQEESGKLISEKVG